jgi:hypothetical protein
MADYIGYIGLTPTLVDNVVLFLFTLRSPHSHIRSAADGETGEEANKQTSPRSHNSRRVAYVVAGLLEKKPMSLHARR